MISEHLASLTDLFGIATTAAGQTQTRDGIDLISAVNGKAQPRRHLFGFYGIPGTPRFKLMVREQDWKYIYIANGGREQLFNVTGDPGELTQRISQDIFIADRLRKVAVQEAGKHNGLKDALEHNQLRKFEFKARDLTRIFQFDQSGGIHDFIVN